MITPLQQPQVHAASEQHDPLPAASQNTLFEHIVPEVVTPQGEMRWGRLIATWNEKKTDGTLLNHVYSALVDAEEGQVYLDCRPSMIFAKCFVQLLVRPFHTVAKTIYHLAMVPILIDLPLLLQQKKQMSDVIKTACRSLADIVRTPMFGIALIAATIGVLASALLDPDTLYDGRRLLGKIEQEANWGQKHTGWTVAKCFQPFPLEVLEWYGMQDHSNDTDYPSSSPMDLQLANFVRSRVRHRQNHFYFFACGKYPLNKRYISSILLDAPAGALEKTLPIYGYIL